MTRSLEEARVDLAKSAFEKARHSADPAERRSWLDYAHRLFPADPTFALALAEALLGFDDARAARLLEGIVAEQDVREPWFALAAARLRLGVPEAAAAALAHALSCFAVPPALAPLAGRVAGAAGAPGWCGLDDHGRVLIGLATGPVATRRLADGRIRITAGGRDLLGSPLAPEDLFRTEGFVEQREDGSIAGWAWLPRNPDRDPELRICSGRSRAGADAIPVRLGGGATSGGGLLARRRAFAVPAAAVAALAPPIRVLDSWGRDLMGSPLPAFAAPPSRAGTGRPARRARTGTLVIIPVHGGGDVVRRCIRSVLATLDDSAMLTIVDDGGREPSLSRWLARLATDGRLTLLRHATPRGFPTAANAGLRRALHEGRDAVLLNSDTLVSGPWLQDLRAASRLAADIGTVTPLSNSGGILSYPSVSGGNPVPALSELRRIADAARAANRDSIADLPTGIGFCLYIRHDCLAQTGLLREDAFSQGYGEENDFCLRAASLGWRHVAATGVFVAHVGGVSMGDAAADLRARNSVLLEQLHPGYHARVEAFIAGDALLPFRRRIDISRWRARRQPASGGATAIVLHDQGGGVERAVRAAAERLKTEGKRVILLRPATAPGGMRGVRVEDGANPDAFPNLAFALPAEYEALLELLRHSGVRRIAFHHLLGHAAAIQELPARLRVPYTVHVHDYAWLCPRVVLLNPARRYCREPDLAGCEACVAKGGDIMEGMADVSMLRARSLRLLRGAASVTAPSHDAAERIARHFPGTRCAVVPHERVAPPPPHRVPGGRQGRIVVIGAIGPAKGYEVLLSLARDAARRGLGLSFVLVGHSTGDAALLATGRVRITGPFAPDEAVPLIRAQDAALAFIPSVVPETWCYALSEAWRAGLHAAAFEIGAQAERIRAAGGGLLLPLNLPPARINDALLAASCVFRHEGAPLKTTTGS